MGRAAFFSSVQVAIAENPRLARRSVEINAQIWPLTADSRLDSRKVRTVQGKPADHFFSAAGQRQI
jgi:hypothetical protein